MGKAGAANAVILVQAVGHVSTGRLRPLVIDIGRIAVAPADHLTGRIERQGKGHVIGRARQFLRQAEVGAVGRVAPDRGGRATN